MKQVDPMEICAQNADSAKARRESDRAAMRLSFPFTAAITDELVAAGFKPRVISMTEGGEVWQRNASR